MQFWGFESLKRVEALSETSLVDCLEMLKWSTYWWKGIFASCLLTCLLFFYASVKLGQRRPLLGIKEIIRIQRDLKSLEKLENEIRKLNSRLFD